MKGKLTKRQDQQMIRALIENFDWETNKDWLKDWAVIACRIDAHNILFPNDGMLPKSFSTRNKMESLKFD